jgi:hypothetical protein
MGTEYALISDVTGEAYDLGRGPWYEWTEGRQHTYDAHVGPPSSRADVDALLAYWQEGWALGLQPSWASVVAGEIWSFLQCHPGARIVSDDDHSWGRPNDELDAELRRAGARVYRQVGSRYEHEWLLTPFSGHPNG